jgi:hypothetical protein
MIEAERRRTEAQVQERKRLRDTAKGYYTLRLCPLSPVKQQKLLFAKFGEQWVRAHHFDKVEKKRRKKEEVIVLWFVIFAVFFYLVSVMVDRWGPM